MVKKASGLSVTKRNGGSKKRGRIVLKVNVREKQGRPESDRLPKVAEVPCKALIFLFSK